VIRSFLLALQFLTIIPVKLKGDVTEAHVARSVVFFPLVGLLQGIVLVAAYLAFGKVFPPGLAVALVLLVLVLINGGFHLDGLADTFDAFACKGDREKRLYVMKDGSVGAIGVTAILFALALKGLALTEIMDVRVIYFALLTMPVLSKWVMMLSMKKGDPAREDGLGRIFMHGIRGGDVAGATLFVLILMALPYIAGVRDTIYLTGAGVGLLMIYILNLLLVKLFSWRFGGLTGDNMGALGEISEVLFLLTVAGWQRLYI
jgi:adenosylcobinamide-GDP ribazoletransferase